MKVRYYESEGRSLWMMQTKDTQPLPNLGDTIVIKGAEYRLLFRRWSLEEYVQPHPGQPFNPPEVLVDIKVQKLG